jgi:hypothetical protein
MRPAFFDAGLSPGHFLVGFVVPKYAVYGGIGGDVVSYGHEEAGVFFPDVHAALYFGANILF